MPTYPDEIPVEPPFEFRDPPPAAPVAITPIPTKLSLLAAGLAKVRARELNDKYLTAEVRGELAKTLSRLPRLPDPLEPEPTPEDLARAEQAVDADIAERKNIPF